MLIYIFNLLSIPLYKMLIGYFKTKRDKDSIILAIVFMQMTIIAGMRGITVGVDTHTYQRIFNGTKSLNWHGLITYYMDTGFMFFNKALVLLGSDYRIALFAYAALIYYLVYRFCNNCSKHKMLTLFLFITMGYFASSMNIMRQFIALGFVLLSYELLMEKRTILCVIPCIIASFFHKSALICLMIVIIYKIIVSRRLRGMTKLLRYLVYIAAIIGGILVTRILEIFGLSISYIQEGAAYSYNLLSFGFVLKIAIVILGVYTAKYVGVDDHERKEYIDFYNFLNVISLLMNVLSSQYNMFTRLNLYFSFTMIVSIPEFIDYINIKNKWIIRSSMIIAFSVMFFLDLLGNNSGIVPYNTLM